MNEQQRMVSCWAWAVGPPTGAAGTLGNSGLECNKTLLRCGRCLPSHYKLPLLAIKSESRGGELTGSAGRFFGLRVHHLALLQNNCLDIGEEMSPRLCDIRFGW